MKIDRSNAIAISLAVISCFIIIYGFYKWAIYLENESFSNCKKIGQMLKLESILIRGEGCLVKKDGALVNLWELRK
jgi:hypothetical protein